ncbi:MAG: orotidine-5'-phosphate decarboxylase [Pyrinomonadaceae bacterium]|nr:orotidine-5'-phosphate decarboxylase [Pyrinomonadaceae bacterium]
MSEAKNRIIVALDVPTADEALRHIDELRNEVGAFKIGLQLITAAGTPFIREVVEDGVKLFLDTKFHDIPTTVAKASMEVARLGVWMFNIHASGGFEMMAQTVDAVRKVCSRDNLTKPKIIGVTVLTSSDQETLRQIGIVREVKDQVRNLALLSEKAGLDGVVASPQEVSLIRESISNPEFMVVTPGIRPSFAAADDQKRTMSPKEATQNGANLIVIGRPILQADSPIEAVRAILSEMDK